MRGICPFPSSRREDGRKLERAREKARKSSREDSRGVRVLPEIIGRLAEVKVILQESHRDQRARSRPARPEKRITAARLWVTASSVLIESRG